MSDLKRIFTPAKITLILNFSDNLHNCRRQSNKLLGVLRSYWPVEHVFSTALFVFQHVKTYEGNKYGD